MKQSKDLSREFIIKPRSFKGHGGQESCAVDQTPIVGRRGNGFYR